MIEKKLSDLERRIKLLEEEQKKDKAQIAYLLGSIQASKTKLQK